MISHHQQTPMQKHQEDEHRSKRSEGKDMISGNAPKRKHDAHYPGNQMTLGFSFLLTKSDYAFLFHFYDVYKIPEGFGDRLLFECFLNHYKNFLKRKKQ